MRQTVPATHFCSTLAVNVDNDKLSDEKFREFVRNTLPIVVFDDPRKERERERERGGYSA